MTGWRHGLVLATLAVTALSLQVIAGAAVPLRVPLYEVPFRIGGWLGRVEPLDPDFMLRARPDEVLSRLYADAAGRVLYVYVGYYTRQASRGQVQEVCAGECQVLNRGTMTLGMGIERLTVNIAATRQDRRAVAVVYWYQHGNTVMSDAYQSKLEQAKRVLLHRRSDGALARISAPLIGAEAEEEAWARSVGFAKVFIPLLRQHLPD